ncbi:MULTISPECIES: malonate transporter subunit MadL [unclassified Psychrobacter]|uniref:malonate transporter subunit MadL n=1 Tax=unclassified Psychrobacter TaxID=196806 RepID=UPI000354A797|nr:MULTISPECIES: malonate transporter subunit MadL [unclassified Psychrobacter]AGP50008.1 malonate transporter, MadL subunit [Psychrobacter sp. G]KAA0934554.1 malonate transporter subunit MadL [Psychrobacter sp. ANT_H59]
MIIYGTALLAVSYLLGVFLGGLLGKILGVDANIGGVAIAMILLIVGKEMLAKKGYLPKSTQFGVLYWAGMYIPIVVAMAAGQNVVAALSGGMVAAVVSVIALTATVFVVRLLNNIGNDYDTFTWDDTEEHRDQL